jgi:hypothetical protein
VALRLLDGDERMHAALRSGELAALAGTSGSQHSDAHVASPELETVA